MTTDEQVYNLVKEKKADDKDELVRTVNIKAKVTFKDGKEPQELPIPITVYKNVYEALNKAGDKPLFLKEAEGKDAKDGGLKDVTGDYVMVTIKASKDFNAKDDKIYYVNKNAWVEIPEVKTEGSSTFVNWTADKAAQNEGLAENGIFDFGKRHKFTENTIISPSDAKDVVEQTDPNKKPDVPNSYVKVIVKTTDKATDETKFEKTFWVNPTKEVTIPATEPTGKENQKFTFAGLGEEDVNYIFKEWQKVQTGKDDDNLTDVTPATKIDLAKNKYTDKVTVIEAAYKKSIQAGKIEEPLKTTKLDTPQGKKIEDKDLIEKITPQEGKEIKSIQVISKPDPSKPGEQKATVIVTYTDGTTQGTNDNPVVIPVEVHKNIIPEAPGGKKPEGALDNYVKVIFKAGTGGTVSGDTVYYVSPEVAVDMTKSAEDIKKTPDVGYFVKGEKWTNTADKTLKGTFTDPETEFVFNFDKYDNIVAKTDDPNQEIPKGYVTVTFKTEDATKGKVDGKDKKIYYVNPTAGITLKVLGKGATATAKQLEVPKTAPAAYYEFEKWYEEIDQSTPITSERIHVAKFKLAKVTLTYEAGEGKGTVPTKVEVDHGTSVRLARPDGLSKKNATFTGWKIGEITYQAGDEVTLKENTTATAQWKTNSHKVSFNTMRGSVVPTQTVEHGKTAINPKAPTLEGKVFMGWKEKESDTAYFDFNTPIEADKSLIAIWQAPVQKIGENDPVEEQFIKVTFLKGTHGTLKDGQTENVEKVTYKVAKEYSFEQAKEKGFVVPGIAPAKYYKAKAENSGWDKALDLTLEKGETEKIFTAQYEPIADVIPIDPKVTPDNKLQDDKPEGMVLVQFKIADANQDKFYIDKNVKYYVKKDAEVRIPTPVVLNKNQDKVFKGWTNVNVVYEPIEANAGADAKVFEWVKQKFTGDTVITDEENLAELKLVITIPRAGAKIVYIETLTGTIGKLEVGGKIYTNTTYTRRGKTYNVFKLDKALVSGEALKYWAEDGTRQSIPTQDAVK